MAILWVRTGAFAIERGDLLRVASFCFVRDTGSRAAGDREFTAACLREYNDFVMLHPTLPVTGCRLVR